MSTSLYHLSDIHVCDTRHHFRLDTIRLLDDSPSSSLSVCFNGVKNYLWYNSLVEEHQFGQPISSHDPIHTVARIIGTRDALVPRHSLSSFSDMFRQLSPRLDYLGIPQELQAAVTKKILSKAVASSTIYFYASESSSISLTWSTGTVTPAGTVDHQPSNSGTTLMTDNRQFSSVEDSQEDIQEQSPPQPLSHQQPDEVEVGETGRVLHIREEGIEGIWASAGATTMRISIIERELIGNRLPRGHLQPTLIWSVLVDIDDTETPDDEDVEVNEEAELINDGGNQN